MSTPSNLPGFVPAKGAPAVQQPTTPPASQNAPQQSSGGDFIDNAISGVKSFFSGIFGDKTKPSTSPTTTKPASSTLPGFVKAGSTATTPTPTTKTTSTPKSNLPGFVPSKPAATPPPDGPVKTSPIADLAQTNTSVEGGTQNTFSADSPEAFGPNFINSLPGSVVKVTKDIAQALPRASASVGVMIGQLGTVISNALTGTPTTSLTSASVPKNMEWLTGTDTVASTAQDIDSMQQTIENSPLAQKIGLDKYSKQLSFAGVLGNDFLQFEGFSGEEVAGQSARDAVISALSKATTEEEVIPILKSIGVNDSLTGDLAPYMANTADKAAISDALDLAETLNRGLSALPDITEMNQPVDTPPENSYSGSVIEHSQDQIKNVYADVSSDVLQQEAGNLLQEMDLSRAGYRIMTGTGADTTVTGVPSTFPEWVPPTLRSKELFNKVLEYVDPNSEKFGTFPPANRPKQRALVYELFNELDSRTGVDTSSFRNNIINEYQSYDDSQQRESASTPYSSPNGGEIDEDEVASKFGGTGTPSITDPNEDAGSTGTGQEVIAEGDPPPEAVPQPKVPTVHEVKAQVPETNIPEMQSVKDIMRGRVEDLKNENTKQTEEDPSQPTVAASESDQRSAAMEAFNGGVQSGPFKGWSTENVKAFQDFVNRRKDDTLKAVGAVIRQRLEGLRQDGIDAILKFEGFERDPETGSIVARPDGPDRSGLLGKTSEINDDLFASEKESGVPVNYRSNYLRIYIKDPETGEVFVDGQPLGGRQVSRKPGFALPRQFKTNAEALQAGYSLVYPNIPDLMQQRAMDSERAIANSDFFNHLSSTGNAVPSALIKETGGPKWISYDPDRFPTKTVRYDNQVHSGTFKGPAPIVEKVNQYLKEPITFLNEIARVFGSIKNFALSIGIPKTGFSVHYWNLLPREVLSDIAVSPLTAPKEIARFLYYGFNTTAARNYIGQNLEKSLPFLRAGMTFSSEEHSLDALDLSKDQTIMENIGKTGTWISKFLHDTFSKNLFSRIIPARKLFQAQRFFDFATKNGMAEDEAYRWASTQVNTMYGGINWEQMGRSKNWQNFMRSVLIAPDYGEGNIKIGSNMAKSFGRLFKTPSAEKEEGEEAIKAGSVTGKLYRNMAFTMIALYITADMINHESTGKHLFQNDPLHQLSIAWGTDSVGRTRYINPFGTGADFIRIPLQVATALKAGKINDVVAVLRNRLSIPIASIMSIITNTDWAGYKIYGPDIYGNPQSTATQMQNVLDNTIGAAAPSSVTSITNVLSGKTSLEQGLIQGAALPVGYVNEKPNESTIKQMEADAKTGIQNGDYKLFNQLVKAKVITARSKATFIRDALTTGGKTAKQLRESAKTKARLAAEEKALQAEGIKKTE